MLPVVVIKATQDAVQNTDQDTFQDANCETIAITDGVEHLVLYGSSQGANSDTDHTFTQLLHGSDVIGYAAGEGANIDGLAGVHACHGMRVIVGDGADTLKFQHRGNVNGGDYDIGAMAINAIPMTRFGGRGDGTTAGSYYWSGTNSGTDEVVNAPEDPTWTTLRSLTVKLADLDEDYLIYVSCEGDPGADSNECNVRLMIDGVEFKRRFEKEGEDAAVDKFCFSWSTVQSLSGTIDIDIEVYSGGGATTDYRRSNIFVVQGARWKQLISIKDPNVNPDQIGTYIDAGLLTATITPTQETEVVVHASIEGDTNDAGVAFTSRLLNETTSAIYREDTGSPNNNYIRDDLSIFMTHVETRSVETTYTVQFRVKPPGGGAEAKLRENSELILWELTPVEDDPRVEPLSLHIL